MATVQQYGTPKVQAQATPLIGRSPISIQPDRSGEIVGNALVQAGDELRKQQEINDQLRVEETLNKLRERQLDMTFSENGGYLNAQGKNALPQNGQTLSDKYVGQFDSYAKELEQGLGNDNQKRIFKQYAARTGIEFRSGVMRHEMQQTDAWRKQTIDGVFAIESDNAAKNWNNPESIDLSRARIDINVGKMRDADGLPAEQANKVRLGALSKMHDGVINAALTNGAVDYAAAYIEKNKSEIDAHTLLKANTLLTKQANAQYGFQEGRNAVVKYATAFVPNDADRIVNITAMSESGNKDFNEDGTPVTSKTGVQYAMQVTKSTARSPGYGIKPADESGDEKQKAAEYNRVGRELLFALLQKNGGDPAKMWAGYNGGQKYVDQAVEVAKLRGSNWLDELPSVIRVGEAKGEVPAGKAEETMAYVAKNMKALGAGLGTPQKPTFAEIDQTLLANPKLASNPEAYKQAREIAKQQYDELNKAEKQYKEEAEGEIYKQLIANGGNFESLPIQLRAAIDQAKIPGIMKTAAEIKKGVPTVTNPALYQKLTTDPTYLKGMSEGQLYALRGELSQSDHQHFVNEWAKLNGRTTASAENAGNVNTSALTQTLNQRLSTMGIDPTPKDGSSDAVRVGAIRQFVTRSILSAQAQTGKKMDDAQTTKFVDGLFANSVELKSFFGGKRNVSALSMTPGDVPSDARDKIKQAFKAAGAPDPSDADILQIYWQQRFSNSGKSELAKAKPPQQEQQKGTGSTSGW